MPIPRAGILAQVKLDATRINLYMGALYCGCVSYCAYRILEKRHEKELDRLDRLEMARVQLESPQFKCYYAALQYRQWQCFDLQLYKTLRPDLPEGIRYENDSRIHELWKESRERSSKNQHAAADINTQLDCSDQDVREKDLMETNYQSEARVTNYVLHVLEAGAAVYHRGSLEGRKWFRRTKRRLLANLGRPTTEEEDEESDHRLSAEEQQQAWREKRLLSVKRERQEVQHCRNLDSIMTRCAGELYAMIPHGTPCQRPLPPSFQPATKVAASVMNS